MARRLPTYHHTDAPCAPMFILYIVLIIVILVAGTITKSNKQKTDKTLIGIGSARTVNITTGIVDDSRVVDGP